MKFLCYLSVYGLLFMCGENLATEAICPKSPSDALKEYYAALRQVDLDALEALTGGKEWIHTEQIVEMSKRFGHFKIMTIKPSKQKGASPKTSAYVRVEEQWKEPESRSWSYFELRKLNECWKIQDFGSESD